MEKILEIINQIASTGSRNEKQNILSINFKENNATSTLLKDVLEFVYSPEFKTGIKRKKLEKEVKHNHTYNIKDFYDLKSYLLDNGTGSDEVIANIQNFLSQQPVELKELYTNIILQDLRCDISEKTVNSAIGYALIREHKVEKGEVAEPKHIEKLKGREFGIYKKLDGYRAEIEVGLNKIRIMSTSGELYRGLIDIEKFLLDANLPHGVFACELLYLDNTLSRMERFNKTGSILRKLGEKHDIEVNVFNFIPDNGFFEGYHPMKCKERKELAKKLVEQINSPLIKNIDPLYIGKDISQIDYWFEKMVEQDDEGIMVLPLDVEYKGKKSYTQMLKIKGEKEADLPIIGFEQGEKGKGFENTLGKIIVDYKGNPAKVMAGYKVKYSPEHDERLVRDYIWTHQEELLGKIVRVRYLDETVNDHGGIDLRLCRLICYRDDKNEPSYN
jgi:DNA ligase-1